MELPECMQGVLSLERIGHEYPELVCVCVCTPQWAIGAAAKVMRPRDPQNKAQYGAGNAEPGFVAWVLLLFARLTLLQINMEMERGPS